MSEEIEKKYQIVRIIGEECIQEDELKNLIAKKPAPTAMMVLNHQEGCTSLRSLKPIEMSGHAFLVEQAKLYPGEITVVECRQVAKYVFVVFGIVAKT